VVVFCFLVGWWCGLGCCVFGSASPPPPSPLLLTKVGHKGFTITTHQSHEEIRRSNRDVLERRGFGRRGRTQRASSERALILQACIVE